MFNIAYKEHDLWLFIAYSARDENQVIKVANADGSAEKFYYDAIGGKWKIPIIVCLRQGTTMLYVK